MNTPASGSEAELSCSFALAELADSPSVSIEIDADADERRGLAARYGLLALDFLTAQLQVRRDINGDIVVEGHLQADVTQECVVTLEHVADSVSAPFEQRYSTVPQDSEDDFRHETNQRFIPPVASLVVRSALQKHHERVHERGAQQTRRAWRGKEANQTSQAALQPADQDALCGALVFLLFSR